MCQIFNSKDNRKQGMPVHRGASASNPPKVKEKKARDAVERRGVDDPGSTKIVQISCTNQFANFELKTTIPHDNFFRENRP